MADDSSHPSKRRPPNDLGNDEQKPKRRGPNPKASMGYRQEQKRLAFEKLSPKEQEAHMAMCKAAEDAHIARRQAELELEAKRKEQRSLFQELLRERPDLNIERSHKSCSKCSRPNYNRYWCPECPCCICKGDDHMADWCSRNETPRRETSASERTVSHVPFEVAYGRFPSSSRLETVKQKNQKRLKQFRGIRSSVLAPGNDNLAKYLATSPVRYYNSLYSIVN